MENVLVKEFLSPYQLIKHLHEFADHDAFFHAGMLAYFENLYKGCIPVIDKHQKYYDCYAISYGKDKENYCRDIKKVLSNFVCLPFQFDMESICLHHNAFKSANYQQRLTPSEVTFQAVSSCASHNNLLHSTSTSHINSDNKTSIDEAITLSTVEAVVTISKVNGTDVSSNTTMKNDSSTIMDKEVVQKDVNTPNINTKLGMPLNNTNNIHNIKVNKTATTARETRSFHRTHQHQNKNWRGDRGNYQYLE